MVQLQLVFASLVMSLCGGWLYGGMSLRGYKYWSGKGGLSLISCALVVGVFATLQRY